MAKQQQTRYPGALWKPHAHFWPGRSGHRIRYLIIHGTAWDGPVSAEQVAEYFQRTTRETGTHFVVGRDGAVVQCCELANSAWGNGIVTKGHQWWWGTRGNPNLETVSIEFVKWRPDNSDALTGAQWLAGFALIQWLVEQTGVPTHWADEAGGITGHYSIDPVNRSFCPGPFPWEEMFNALQQPGFPPGPGGVPTGATAIPGSGFSGQTGATALLAVPATGRQTDGSRPSAGTRAHQVLQDLPGFAGLVTGLDQIEAFDPWQGNLWTFLGGNMGAIVVRLALIVGGFALLLALFVAIGRRNAWMSDAGLDTLGLILKTRR